MPELIIDLGTATVAAAVVSEESSWLVADPASGSSLWPCAMHWDGERVSVGDLAEHRRRVDPAGYAAGFTRGLAGDAAVMLGARRFRPFEQVAEMLAGVRAQAARHHGWIDRTVVTVPTDYGPADHRRARLLAAAETAGFTAVELLTSAVAVVSAPDYAPHIGVDEIVLVYDLGATFEATLLRVGTDEILGHVSIVDWNAQDVPFTLVCCHDLLARHGVPLGNLAAVLPVGGGCRLPGLLTAIERDLGVPVRQAENPELVVVRGAVHWLLRSGSRTVMATSSPDRIVPLTFAIPGGAATLVRWLVAPQEPYGEGAALARVRLASGALWDLTARTGGTLDQHLVGPGSAVAAGDWVALARSR